MFPKKIFGTNKDILIIPRDKLYLQMRFDNCFVTLEDIGESEAVDCLTIYRGNYSLGGKKDHRDL